MITQFARPGERIIIDPSPVIDAGAIDRMVADALASSPGLASDAAHDYFDLAVFLATFQKVDNLAAYLMQGGIPAAIDGITGTNINPATYDLVGPLVRDVLDALRQIILWVDYDPGSGAHRALRAAAASADLITLRLVARDVAGSGAECWEADFMVTRYSIGMNHRNCSVESPDHSLEARIHLRPVGRYRKVGAVAV